MPIITEPRARAAEGVLAETTQRIIQSRADGVDPWFYTYCGSLAAPAEVKRYLRYQLDNIEFHSCDPMGRDVLDAGCGFGFTLVTYGLLGARGLYGIDNYQGMVDTIHAYADMLPSDVKTRLDVIKGTVADMPYPDASFDLVLSYEAISHYDDVDAFLGETHRVLRPGGTLMISDGNNGINPLISRKTRRVWDVVENGPAGTRVEGHLVEEPLNARRARFITEHFPDIAPGDSAALADRTSGMWGDDLVKACERFRQDGTLPSRTYQRGDLPVEPYKGEVIERLFNPFKLARKLRESGFDATVNGYWGGASGRKLLRGANRALTALDPVLTFTARAFHIKAVRTDG